MILAVAVVLYGTTVAAQSFPSSFFKTREPQIDNSDVLKPVFQKLNQKKKPVRIVHIGDSHVRGHVFTVAAREALEKAWGSQAVEPQKISYNTAALAHETGKPGLVYHAIGINGATCQKFSTPEMVMRVSTLKPDLIIISLGTNESIGHGYYDAGMRAGLDTLVSRLQRRNPNVRIMLTTPPGCYLRQRTTVYRHGGHKTYRYTRIRNTRTHMVAEVQRQYTHDHDLALFDLYRIVGDDAFALRNWQRAGMLRADGVHFTHHGYQLMGKLLSQGLIDARDKSDTMTRK